MSAAIARLSHSQRASTHDTRCLFPLDTKWTGFVHMTDCKVMLGNVYLYPSTFSRSYLPYLKVRRVPEVAPNVRYNVLSIEGRT